MSMINNSALLNNSNDSVASANFIALHEKINQTEETLNEINEQTKKKFQIVKENIIKIRNLIENERAKAENNTLIKINYINRAKVSRHLENSYVFN